MAIFQTAASADDAIEAVSGGAVIVTGDGQTAGTHDIAGNNHVGFRFPSVTIAQGATILNAKLYFDQLANYTGTGTIANVTLYGQNVDNAAQFTTTTSDISSRARTSAFVTAMDADQTPWQVPNGTDVAAIVQEIVNRAGWASGNAMAMLFIGTGTSLRFIRPYQWDYFSGTYLARLEINKPAAGRPKNRYGRQAVQRSVNF